MGGNLRAWPLPFPEDASVRKYWGGGGGGGPGGLGARGEGRRLRGLFNYAPIAGEIDSMVHVGGSRGRPVVEMVVVVVRGWALLMETHRSGRRPISGRSPRGARPTDQRPSPRVLWPAGASCTPHAAPTEKLPPYRANLQIKADLF